MINPNATPGSERPSPRKLTRPKGSIRGQLVGLLFGITLVASFVLIALVVYLVSNINRQAGEMSSQSLREQAEAYLVQLNTTIASQNDLILDRAARDVRTAAEAAAAIYAGNLPSGYWPADEHLFQGPEGQFLNGPEDTSSVFVPNTTSLNSLVSRDIELSAYLDLALQPIFNNNPNAAAIYFGSIHNVTRYFPNIELGKLVPPDFQVTKRPWFTACVQGNPDPTQPSPVWSPVYLDATGLGLVTTVAFPVFTPSASLAGVVGLDLTLNEISKNIQASSLLQAGYSFLIDQNGLAIILPEQGYHHLLGRPPEPDEFATDLSHLDSPFATVIHQMLQGNAGFQSVSTPDGELFVAFAPLPSTHWALASVVPANVVLQSVAELQNELTNTTRNLTLSLLIPIALLFMALSLLVGMIWINRLVSPVQKLTAAASKLGEGEWDTPIPIISQNEIGFLGATLAEMRDRLRRSFQELEHRVAERTADLEHRALQLQTSAEVMRVIASERNLEALLTRITQLISQRFGYYHVGVFMPDDRYEYMVLRAANSPGGQRMLQRQHKLRIGETGIVGTVAGTRQPRITLDVNLDEVWYKNPDLPATRSEMALPLVSGGKLLGVLDLQSDMEAAFKQEDIAILQTLADQIAVAIENALLFAENQEAMEIMQRAFGELSQKAWEKLLRTRPEFGYLLREDGSLEETHEAWSEEMVAAHQRGEIVRSDGTLYTPLKLRDQVLGVVKLRKPPSEADWTPEEINLIQSICDQVSLALESARLYEESQRRAERERLSGEIISKVRASNDPQVILQTAVRELRRVLNAQHAQVLIQSVHYAEESEEPRGKVSEP